jgi:HPt (histidine-containing phosphotransfer) domain-containing protein
MADDRRTRMAAAVAAAWEEARPRIMGRVAALEATAAALRDGGLDSEMRRNAEAEAHKLSGSLGMFGFPLGSELAHEIEERLDGDGPIPNDFVELVERLAGELADR